MQPMPVLAQPRGVEVMDKINSGKDMRKILTSIARIYSDTSSMVHCWARWADDALSSD